METKQAQPLTKSRSTQGSLLVILLLFPTEDIEMKSSQNAGNDDASISCPLIRMCTSPNMHWSVKDMAICSVHGYEQPWIQMIRTDLFSLDLASFGPRSMIWSSNQCHCSVMMTAMTCTSSAIHESCHPLPNCWCHCNWPHHQAVQQSSPKLIKSLSLWTSTTTTRVLWPRNSYYATW